MKKLSIITLSDVNHIHRLLINQLPFMNASQETIKLKLNSQNKNSAFFYTEVKNLLKEAHFYGIKTDSKMQTN